MKLTRRCQNALTQVMKPDGFNIGINLGKVRRRRHSGASAHSRRAALERRHQLHARPGEHDRGAGGLAANWPPNSAPPWPSDFKPSHCQSEIPSCPLKPSISKTPASPSSSSTTTRATCRRSKINSASKPPPAKAGSSSKARPTPWSAPSTSFCCSKTRSRPARPCATASSPTRSTSSSTKASPRSRTS